MIPLWTLLIALVAQSTPQPTVEVIGYTDAGEYVRLRGVMLGASYVSCQAAPCLDVVADRVVVVGDAMFADGFDSVADAR